MSQHKGNLFEGILLCSDMDGTLAEGTSIPHRNLDAIASFTAQGGLFTVSSGRDHDYLEKWTGGFCNAPFICLNGAMIFDAKTGQKLFDAPMARDSVRTLFFLKEHDIRHEALYMYVGHGKGSVPVSLDTFSPDDVGDEPIYKLLFVFKTPEETQAVQRLLSEAFPEYQFTRSWYVGLEQLSADAGKGFCVRHLKAHLGAKRLICVGDFENDASMFQAADMAFAPQNALHQVCHVAEGAIADIISKLPLLL